MVHQGLQIASERVGLDTVLSEQRVVRILDRRRRREDCPCPGADVIEQERLPGIDIEQHGRAIDDARDDAVWNDEMIVKGRKRHECD